MTLKANNRIIPGWRNKALYGNRKVSVRTKYTASLIKKSCMIFNSEI
jgi:hypothetical protein